MNTISRETLAAEFSKDIPLATATAAHSGTSWTPEKRGEWRVREYGETLAADYIALSTLPADSAQLEEEFTRYREGYRKRYLAMLHSSARCVSWAIAGPSNFPAARMNKRADIAHKRMGELLEFRERALKAIRRTLCPEQGPIMAGQDNAVELLERKIAEAERLHELMLATNKAHKAFKKDPTSLDAAELPQNLKDSVRSYVPRYSWEPHPIAPYQLTNSSANIRRMKDRLESVRQAKATPAVEAEGTAARVEDCPADNRVRLFFPGKPDADVRGRLKSCGFRWSPTIGAWQAYRNERTIQIARKEAGLV